MGIVLIFIIVFFLYYILYNIARAHNKNKAATPIKKHIKNGSYSRVSIKAIVRWEQFKGKPFSLIDYGDRDDIILLMYTAHICNHPDRMCTFDVFKQIFTDDKIILDMSSSTGRDAQILSQFQKKTSSTGNGESIPQKISDIVSDLIVSGLDAHYVLEEMDLCDLPMYIEACERHKKERMESDRLWTFLTVLPHIDAKKMRNGAKDLITFPWEAEKAKEEAERTIQRDSNKFEQFMKTKKENYYGKE